MSDEFVKLIRDMKSDDNEVRKQAENIFHKTRDVQPNETLQSLLQVARTHKDIDVRAFSAVLLKKVFALNPEQPNVFTILKEDVQNIFRVELLNGLDREPNIFVKKLLCDLIADLAAVIFSNHGTWDEMLKWCIKSGQTDDKDLKFCTFRIFKEIAGYFPEIPLMKQSFKDLVTILLSGLTFDDVEVKIECLYATETFVQFCKGYRASLQKLIDPMLQTIPYCLGKDQEHCEKAIQVFIDLAEIDPGFFQPRMDSITEAMINLASSPNLPPDVNRLAAEFLITLAENKKLMCKSNQNFVRSCIEILLKMMLNTPDISIEQWKVSEEGDDIRNYVVAEEYLDRLSLALEGETIVPLIWNYIPQFVDHENWIYRHTALKALAMIAEGCVDILLPGLKDIVAMLVRRSEDSDPRVRHATAYAIGQLSTDFGPQFQNDYHEQIIPKLINLINDFSYSKVQCHAAAALVNFCEKFDAPLLEPYINDLLVGLFKLVNEGSKKIQEQAILAICIVANCAEKKFIPYYDKLMPSLVQLFQGATDKNYRTLRGKTMLCISSVCMAVGKEKMEKDSNQILQMLKDAQDNIVDNDDPQEEFFLDSWANIARCLGPDFSPYLEVVIPSIIESASKEIEFQVAKNDEEIEGWQYFDIGKPHKVGIHTSALDEKEKACNLLCNYAMATKEAFFPYIESVSKIMVPLLEFLFNDEIKITAYVILPYLIKSARFAIAKNNVGKSYLTTLFNYIYSAVFANAIAEKESDMLLVALESVHQCIHAVAEPCLTDAQLLDIFQQLKIWVEDIRANREELETNIDNDNDETLFVREELSKDGQLVAEIAEIITACVKYHPNFLKIFNEADMINYTLGMINDTTSDCERQLGICMFDDIVEYTKEISNPLYPAFIPAILKYAKDPHTGIRQAITYGLGVYCQYGGTAIQPYLEQILNILVETITKSDSRNKTYASSTENAISSVGKIIRYQTSFLKDKLPDLIKLWLSWLPLQIDIIEAKAVHQHLCDLIEINHPGIFGENFSNLPVILSIFADIISSKLVKKTTDRQIVSIIKQMQSQNPDIVNQAFSTLPQTKQERLIRQLN